MISVIIPWLRPVGYRRCIKLLKRHAGDIAYEIVSEHNLDPEHVTGPMMCNRLMRMAKGEYLMILADDVIPHVNIFTDALATMEQFRKGKRGLIGLQDQMYGTAFATHWMISRSFYRQFKDGQVFSESYHHCYSDVELVDIAKEQGCFAITPLQVITHNHKGLKSDKHYRRAYNAKKWAADRRTYIKRQKERIGWGKVAIGIRVSKPAVQFIWPLIGLIAQGRRTGDTIIRTAESMPHAAAANFLAGQFLKTDCNTLLMIDDDMVFPPDTLEKMRSHYTDMDVLSCLAVCRHGSPGGSPHNPIALVRYDMGFDRMINATASDISLHHVTGKPILVETCGLAFTLIRRWVIEDVLKAVSSGPFIDIDNHGEDYGFCHHAAKAGASIGVDTYASIGHCLQMSGRYDVEEEKVKYESV
jgi:GT2 family glycosyltransferase